MIGTNELLVELATAVAGLPTDQTRYRTFTARRVLANDDDSHELRLLGVSANEMTKWAFDPDQHAPMPLWAPADAGDLGACKRTLQLAIALGYQRPELERMSAYIERGIRHT